MMHHHSIPDAAFCGFMKEHPCNGLLVALSGGADSVVLLHLAHRHQPTFGYRLEALHVHHGIRGQEADRDALFCQALCDQLQIPLRIVHYDIPALAKADGKGMEETARHYRYLALTQYTQEAHLERIATAHTATDHMETVLFQLTRGTGTIHGIPPVRDAYLRPLLSVGRSEILAYLQAHGLSHVEDSTNADECYTRNLIRRQVVPTLMQINPQAEQAFLRAAKFSGEDDAYLYKLAAISAQDGHCREMAELPAPLRRRALILRCRILGIEGLTARHLEDLNKLIVANVPHSRLSLPGGILVIENGCLIRWTMSQPIDRYKLELHPGENYLPDGSILCWLTGDRDEIQKYTAHQQNIYKLLTKTTLNFATIKGRMFARPRQAGDQIISGGMHRSIKKLYSAAGLSPALRSSAPILWDIRGAIWISALNLLRDGVSPDDSTEVCELQWWTPL